MKKKVIKISILSILLILSSAYTFISLYCYCSKQVQTEIDEKISVDSKQYIIELSEKHKEKQFPIKKTQINIKLYKDDPRHPITDFIVDVDTNGKAINSSNYKIETNSEYVKLSFYNYKKEIEGIYRLYLIDYNIEKK